MRVLTSSAVVLSMPLLFSPVWAQQRAPVPPPPQISPSATPEEEAVAPLPALEEGGVEPEVTIIQRRDATIEEYRVNGRLYRIKVTPRWGFPYYLVPTREEGVFETRLDDLAPLSTPRWLLFSW
jgi:uncharacterized protein DUF2782